MGYSITHRSKKMKRKIVGYCHKSTCQKKEFGWYYPIICTRKSFKGMIKGLGKGAKKYWRKVTLIVEDVK